MYTVLEGDDTASLSCTDGSTFTVANQFTNGQANALTSGSYFQAASTSCSGCSAIQSDTCTSTLVDGQATIS